MAFPREAFITEAKNKGKSEKFISESLIYIDDLNSRNLPVIFSIVHLAIEVGYQSDFIKFLVKARKNNYTYFLLMKKNRKNGYREIMSPKEELKYLQRWINFNILQKCNYDNCVQGFVQGSSTLSNAKIHQGAKYLLKIDLLKFFDTITEDKVYQIFVQMGYVKNLAYLLAKLCTTEHRDSYWNSFNLKEQSILEAFVKLKPAILPQGAPTSPLLANIAAKGLDAKIIKLQKEKIFNYSRYADDLCFSANSMFELPKLETLKEIISESGFFINEEKIKLTKEGMKQYVTGLTITHSINVPKHKRKEIFKHLYFLNKYGQNSHLNKLKSKGINKSNFQGWLLGNISYHYSINKNVGEKMFGLYNKVNWEIH